MCTQLKNEGGMIDCEMFAGRMCNMYKNVEICKNMQKWIKQTYPSYPH